MGFFVCVLVADSQFFSLKDESGEMQSDFPGLV